MKSIGIGQLFKSRSQILVLVPICVMLVSTILFTLFIDQILFQNMMTNVRKDSVQKAHGTGQIVRLLQLDFSRSYNQKEVISKPLRMLQNQVGILSQYFESRVTVIADSGVVLADSDMSAFQLTNAQNHAERPEILQAKLNGKGISQRHSATLGIDFLYAAVLLKLDGNAITVRIATPLDVIISQRDSIRYLLVLGALSSILIVGFAALAFGRKLSTSIKMERDKIESGVSARTEILSTLQELGTMLAMCHNLSEAGNVIEAQMPSLIPDSSGALALMNNSRDLMIIGHEWGGVWSKGQFYAPNTCWSLRKNEVHQSNEGQLICQHLDSDVDLGTICIPLMAQGETLGIIHLRKNGQIPLTAENLETAHAIGKESAIAISNLNLRETLEQQARHDPLTGLYNRRHLIDQFNGFAARANQNYQPFCLLVVDVDHFKSYNDQYGHDAGDYVLTQLAKKFRKSLRTSDIACRLGGEEFALILTDMDNDKVNAFANKLRTDIESLNLIFEGRPLGEITISVGLSRYPDEGTSLPELLKSADDFLYQAKRSGRNRVCGAQAA